MVTTTTRKNAIAIISHRVDRDGIAAVHPVVKAKVV
jgi:hypothetical protein